MNKHKKIKKLFRKNKEGNMKKFIIISIFLGLIFTSVNFNALANETTQEKGYISLSGERTKEVEPNLATITFAVENTAQTAQKAAEENNAASNKIITALKDITNAQTDVIKTSNFSIAPIYSNPSSGKREIKSYSAVNSVTVQTKDISKVSKLIDTAIASGANRTNNLYYTFENNNSICNELYPEILKELKNNAQTIAIAGGSAVTGIKHINASCNTDMAISNGRFFNAKAMMADGAAGESAISTPVESGKVKVRVYVNVDFYLK